MTLAGVRAGDIVFCDIRGDRFFARVRGEVTDGRLPIESLTGRPIPALRVGARQVRGHWRRSKASRI